MHRLSKYAYFASVALMLYTSLFFYPRWHKPGCEAAISWDVSGYYWYLPSIFIYKDIEHQGFADSILHKYVPTDLDFQQAMKLPNGNYVMKYSSGMALMYLPFFTAAHLAAGALGYPRDGFSTPYQLGIQLGGLLVSLIGLWYLRKLLLLYFEDKIVAIVLASLTFGTNYLNLSSVDCGMSHTWLFTLYVFLLLNTKHYYDTFQTKYAVRIGLLVGLCTLTRPTDIVSCLIPLCWACTGFTRIELRKFKDALTKNITAAVVAPLCAFAVFSIQLFYWKHVSGHWFVYSYSNQKFSFTHPHPMLYTFSYRTGWLRYCPMMLLAFAGVYRYLNSGAHRLAILAFFFINYYIVCSWDIWYYGGRAMVQSYPILAFPMAACIEGALKKPWTKWLYLVCTALFLYANTWIMWMYHRGTLYEPDKMNANYYNHVITRWTAPDSLKLLLDNCDYFDGNAKNVKSLYVQNFDGDTGRFIKPAGNDGHKFLFLNKNQPYSPTYSFKVDEHCGKWLRFSALFKCPGGGQPKTEFITRLVDSKMTGHRSLLREGLIDVEYVLHEGDRATIGYNIRVPERHFDHIDIVFRNPPGTDCDILIRDLKVSAFDD